MIKVENNLESTEITISGIYTPMVIPPCEIYNITKNIIINLNELSLTPSEDYDNSEKIKTLKVKINYGDGETEIVEKTISYGNKSVIEKTIDFNNIKHTFNEVSNTESTLIIELWNMCGDKLTFQIPYRLTNKSIYYYGSEFKLLNGALTNNNKSCYTLAHENSSSFITIKSK